MRLLRLLIAATLLGNTAITAASSQDETKPSEAPAEKKADSTIDGRVALSVAPSSIDDLAETLDTAGWGPLYASAKAAYDKRIYDVAEAKLLEAIKKVKQGMVNEKRLILSRNLLADLYLDNDRVEDADKLYSWCVGAAKHNFGTDSEVVAHAQGGLAATMMRKGKYVEAQELCKSALRLDKNVGAAGDDDHGKELITMGWILAKQGWNDQAEKFFNSGLEQMEKNPGYKQLNYSDALRQVALFDESQGRSSEAETLFEKSGAIKDKCIDYTETAHLKGMVHFQWEGSPRSQEIPDATVPLRYICANNVRVACAIIDLWELFGVLISVTNVGDQKVDLGLGDVVFWRTTDDAFDPKAEKLELVPVNRIDRIRREMDIWRMTSNRPWFANMQKTRNVRGLVPAHGHDLFRGPNVFGVYGDWNATNRVLPDRFALEPSPEHVEDQAQVVVDPSLIRKNNTRVTGLIPVNLEPFESRTGELFYMNPRCEHVLLRVYVGNTAFDFPFKTPKRRTAF